MFEKLKTSIGSIEKYKTIAYYEKGDEERRAKDKIIIYVFCAAASLVLSIFNFIDGYTKMLIATLALTISLLVCVVLEKFFKKYLLGDIIAAVFFAITFSFFALNGANEGFAILWILILPPVMINVNRQVGLALSIYLLLFVFVICYTPIRVNIAGYYTTTFLERFPLLCATNFLIVFYIWSKSARAEKELAIKTYVDELTDIFNRQFYRVVCNYIDEQGLSNKVTIVSLDVNGLKMTNDKFGHLAGDELIKDSADIIKEAFDPEHTFGIFRIGGDEFVAILKCDRSDIPSYERRLNEAQKKCSEKRNKTISLSYGFALGMDYPDKNTEVLYNIADEMMLANKTRYYVTNKIDRRQNERRGVDRRVVDLINDSK